MRELLGNIRYAGSFHDFLGDLAAVDVEPVARGGIPYAVIAARSNPRWWLLPLDNRRAAVAGLEMLQPMSLRASLAKAGARALARFGPHTLLGKGNLRLSGLPDLVEAFNGRATSVAYFTGTDGPHRKTSMQIMDSDGAILGYAKISRAPHVRPYLRREASMLGHFATKGLRSADIPRVQAYLEDAAVTIVVTDSLKSAIHTTPLALGPDHLAFLEELRSHGEANCAGVLLDDLATETRRLAALAGPDWTARMAHIDSSLRPHADSIPLCLCHGDFTPWNTFVQGKRLYVFDWEYARTDWPVGFDLTHFLLSTTSPAAQLDRLPELIQTLAETQFHGDMTRAARALLLSLACHALFYLGRLQEVNAALDNWTDSPGRAALIDRLLSQTATS
jgi:hypothetical protein